VASLTTIAVSTRRAIRYGFFFVIFLIVVRILFGLGSGIYHRIFPSPPPPPTVSFGKLDKLPFPDLTAQAGKAKINLTYTLETPEGGLPTLPTQAKVFFMPKQVSNLLALDVAKEKAAALGFSPTEQEVSPTIYRFPHRNSPATLEVNIVTGIFSISYDLKADPSPLERRPPAPEVAASTVRSYLSAANLLPEDLTGPTLHEFLKIEGDSLVGALSLSDADLVKINFFRKTFDNLPSFTPAPDEGNVWFIVSGAQERDKQIIAAEFHYFPVDEGQSSTYPIKTAQTAWDELNAGNVYVASYGQNQEGANVKIRRIYLAYYDGGLEMQFYQPIIVLEGDNGFMAYTPAVTPDYYGE
jgi:hypothetical protein